MAEYAAGAATKEKIIYSCQKLFYNKGIKNTSYDDICSAANINRGLIPYYFKSKNNIAILIYTNFIDNLEKAIGSYFHAVKMSQSLYCVVVELLFFDLLVNNKNVCLFYNEIESDLSYHEATLRTQANILKRISDDNHIMLEEKSFRTIVTMAEGVEKELVHNIYNNYLQETVQEFVYRDIMSIFSMVGVNKKHTQILFDQSLVLTEDLRAVVDENFNCFIQKTVD